MARELGCGDPREEGAERVVEDIYLEELVPEKKTF